jgi:glutamate--cysteine ligase
VRPRGFLELRAADALPAPWRFVHAVLVTGLVYDGQARGAALDLLERHAGELDSLWRLAARAGLSDARLGEPARRLWALGLEGARRLGPEYFRRRDLRDAEAFLERFVEPGRAPAADLSAALDAGAAAALDWAAPDPCEQGSEPAPAA